jgi:hypothetical protein
MTEAAGKKPILGGCVLHTEGFCAGESGAPADRNPFRPGTQAHELWHAGWLEGRAAYYLRGAVSAVEADKGGCAASGDQAHRVEVSRCA